MKRTNLLLSLVLAVMAPAAIYPQSEAVYIESVKMDVASAKMSQDDKGTNVDNIYTFTVDYQGKQLKADVYNVLYYLDGNYVEEFKNQKLPFTIKRDFRGQLDGAHEIRFDLETSDLKIIGRQKTVINVLHKTGK